MLTATEEYQKALRMGQRDYQIHLAKGHYPYLQVLDEILSHTDVSCEVNLGLVQIPVELIVGTNTAGRRTAFAPNFMPLLKPGTEFSSKWTALCEAHLEEGIRDPIKAYEFMNRFYIMEGNKRVSVLKYFDAVTIPGYVTRVLPKRSEAKDNKIYYEFVNFYRATEINYVLFSEEGCYEKLVKAVGKLPDEVWSEDDKLQFRSNYNRFQTAYESRPGKKLPITTGDAFLVYINIYGYNALKDKMPHEIKSDLTKSWDEIALRAKPNPIKLVMNPAQEPKQNIFTKLLPPSKNILKVAFVHDKTAETSSWTYGHELGRLHLEEVFAGQIETCKVESVQTETNASVVMDDLVTNENDIIFTTTPQLIRPSLKAAIEYPDVKILNCSLNASHRYIRTYYSRMYEAKFLTGIVAGALCDNDKIGYIADYPIYGMVANINAFALGAKMINPRAKIYLHWSKVKNKNTDFLQTSGVSFVSNQDLITPNSPSRQFGLYHVNDSTLRNVAMPVQHWGKFYERLIRLISSGSWKGDEESKTSQAVNYWWGLSAGVIDVICSKNLPSQTHKLIRLLKQAIIRGDFNPFSGILYSQDGIVQKEKGVTLSPENIITMDWLCDNIVGSIPTFDELDEEAQALVLLQGVDAVEKN